PPAEEQEAPEGEQVGVHDPGERGRTEAEVGADRRQRDVHDRRVEDDHQIAQAEDVEREPAAAAVEGHELLSIAVTRIGRAAHRDLIAMSSGPGRRLYQEMQELALVDVLARLQLVARRYGFELRVVESGEEVRCVIELAGLSAVLALEPKRQPEEREERLDVEEEGELGDPAA